MKPKSYKTEPFKETYKVYDKYAGVCLFSSTDLLEAYDVFWKHSSERYKRTVFRRYWYDYKPGSPMRSYIDTVYCYGIWDNFGNEVPYHKFKEELNKRYPRRKKKYDRYPIVIRHRKNDPNKIKSGYSYAYDLDDNDWGAHKEFVTCRYFRSFKTHMGERRQNAGHCTDYGERFVRGSRRAGNMADPWDDYPNNTRYSLKSWKTNSKRIHQWKVK